MPFSSMPALFSVNNYGMKRFIFSIVLAAVIFGTMLYFIPQSMQADVFGYSQYNPVVSVYCRETSLKSIDLGLGRQVTCTIDELTSVLAECSGVDGVSVTFDGALDDVNAVVTRLRAKEVNRQQINGLTVVCYYSPLIRNRVSIGGETVNVQIAYRSGTITVGYPLILGSY